MTIIQESEGLQIREDTLVSPCQAHCFKVAVLCCDGSMQTLKTQLRVGGLFDGLDVVYSYSNHFCGLS